MDNDGHQRSTAVSPNLGSDQRERRDQRRLTGRSLHGMQGVRGSNPLCSTAMYQGKRSARATLAGRRTPAKPQFGRLAANTGRYQAI
jgi:hypothetical protein